ncbi:MAG: autotransporter-associated beta strand repeat-containing protein [Planctomycetia bacterium]|nr:autotransporter-associated beta strand repeat-containing protein [Planctomycetia bacterium]
MFALTNSRGANATLNVNFNGGVFRPGASTSNFFGTATNAANLYAGNNGALIDTNGFNLTFAQPIMNGTAAGTVGFLTKSGAGVLTLSGSNTYTGVNTISAGALNLGVAETAGVSGPLGNSAAANPGNIVLTGGTLQYSAANQFDYSGRFSTAANQAYNVDTNSQNVTWATNLSSSGGTLTKSGAGTLTLSASNSYTGITTLGGGVLSLGNADALTGGGNVTFTSGTLQYGSGITTDLSARIKNSGSAVAIDTGSNPTITFASPIDNTNTGGLIKSGTGALVLAAANTYTGTTTIGGGVLTLDNASALGGGGNVRFTGGTLQYGSGITTDLSARIKSSGSAVAIDTGSNAAVTFASSIDNTNTGGIAKSGTGTLTLSVGNGYTGATRVLDGTLVTATTNVIPDGSAISVAAGATFRLGGNDSVSAVSGEGTLDLRSGSTLTAGGATWGAQTLTYSGLITGSGGMVVNTNTGWLAITGSNNFTGGYNASAGITYLGDDNALGAGQLTVGGVVASLDATTRTIGNALTWPGGNAVFGTATTGNLVFTGTWTNQPSVTRTVTVNNAQTQFNNGLSRASSSAGRIKAGSGTLILGGSSTYTGVTTINSGTLQLGIGSTDGTLSPSSVISGSAGATLAFNRTNAIVQGTDFANGISGGMGLAQIGTGTLTLSASNSYSGGTTLSAGRLNINNTNAIGTGTFTISGGSIDNTTAGAVTLSTNNAQAWNADFTFAGTRNLNLGTGTVTLSANRQVTTSSGTLTVGGPITGAFGLTKAGAGTLVVGGASTYTGDTFVSAGTLALGADNAISGSSAITVGSGGSRGTLNIGAFDLTTASLTFDGVGGDLPTGATGEIFLQSSAGPASVSAVSGSSTLHPKLNLSSDALFTVASGASLALHADVFGAGSLTKSGLGTMTMHGGSGYSGGTYLTQGQIMVVGANSLVFGTGTITMSDDTILDLGGAAIDNVITFATGTATTAVILNSGSFVSLSGPGNISSGTAATITASYKLLNTADITFESPLAASVLVQAGGRGVFSGEVSGLVSVAAGGQAILNGNVTGDVVSSGTTSIYGSVFDNVAVNGGTTLLYGTTAVGSVVSTGTGGVAATALLSGTVNGGAHVGSLGRAEFSNLVTGDITSDVGGTIVFKDGYSSSASTINNNGSLVVERSAALALAASISGSGSLTKLGAGALALSGINGYTGATLISGGRLTVESTGSLNGTSGITMNGGDFKYNAATTLTPSITFAGAGGTLSGTGTIGSALTVGTNAVLSPGNSPGTQTFTNGLAWAPGGTYVWELNSLSGTAGTSWDLLNVSGGMFDISGLSASGKFNLDLVTLNGSNVAGPLDSSYVPGSTYEFLITSFATLGSGTSNFGPNSDLTSLFNINLTGWQGIKPSLSDMSVRVNAAGNGIQLVIVPEPSTMFFAGLGVVMAGWWRLRRRAA